MAVFGLSDLHGEILSLRDAQSCRERLWLLSLTSGTCVTGSGNQDLKDQYARV